MTLHHIEHRLRSTSLFFSKESIMERATVIGYEKIFRWRWFATLLNTFLVASDFGNETITGGVLERFLTESFQYAQSNYRGWPRGFQSGLGVISVLISENIGDDAIEYCTRLQSGKKWAGFSVPVAINSSTGNVYSFEESPIWGGIYYSHFKAILYEVLY